MGTPDRALRAFRRSAQLPSNPARPKHVRRLCRRVSLPSISAKISLWNVSRREGEMMIRFKGAHVAQELMLTCVRWYVAYPPRQEGFLRLA